jgi:hypothetical protein
MLISNPKILPTFFRLYGGEVTLKKPEETTGFQNIMVCINQPSTLSSLHLRDSKTEPLNTNCR